MSTPVTPPDPALPEETRTPAAPRRRITRPVLGIIAAAAVLGVMVGIVAGPAHQTVSSATSGDADLAARIRALPGSLDGFRALSVAEITPGGTVFAGVGDADNGAPKPDTIFELGSITKTFTGALFAEAIKRGEVKPDDELATHLPSLKGTPAGTVKLASMAQHLSGLPGLGATANDSAAVNILFNENAYAATTTDRLVADAAVAPVDPEQGSVYSNFAVSLLGTALVEAAGAKDYASLLKERITGPLGMKHTTVAATAAEVPKNAVTGHLLNGTPAPRWWGEGYLPSGASTFTTAADLALWAKANLDGTAPGAEAMEPTGEMGKGVKIGWAWVTSPAFDGKGVQVWHNGGTAGFRTILVLNREARTAVIALSNTQAPADYIALSLANGTPVNAVNSGSLLIGWIVFGIAMLFGLIALVRALRPKAILPSVSDLIWATFGLLLLWRHGPWFALGGWLWGIALAPALAALALLVFRTRRDGLPFLPARRAWLWWPVAAIGTVLAVIAAMLW